MLEVVAYYEKEGPLPSELGYMFDFRRFGVLPNPGGTRDQIVGELDRMALCARIYDIWRVSREEPAKWALLSQLDWQNIIAIREIRTLRIADAKR